MTTDTLEFQSRKDYSNSLATKSSMLGGIASLYDPTGVTSPLKLPVKQLFQQVLLTAGPKTWKDPLALEIDEAP